MNGKSGKLVAPAVAFMLCAVALIGVGFAITLNSTSTATGNSVSTDGLVLNVTDKNGGDTASFSESAKVYYQTTQSNGGAPIYKIVTDKVIVGVGKITVTSPGNANLKIKCTVTSTSVNDYGLSFKVYIGNTLIDAEKEMTIANLTSKEITVVASGDGRILTSIPDTFTYTLTVTAALDVNTP
ncbi:MAG: hypothetical protein PUK31_00800, partial [Candidatus Methanomethylophilaceae archaeon]|nr:hypothetical protein [Candidatus Methanomethylophilaceae archaeon]